tara:strand:+ start:1286 stop:1729 length:444 start_codon:yes stop_codon:yes gene_type:complete
MIEQGQMTIIDTTTYRCIKIDSDGYAHLKNILHEQGRPKLIERKYCPYIVDGQLIVPEKPAPKPIPRTTKINVTKLIKENTDLTISNSAKYFISEWVETAIANLIANAEENAINRGDKRITAAHFFWLETNNAPNGYWKENEEYMQD